MNKELIDYIKRRYVLKFNSKSFNYNLRKYKDLKCFKANENIFETNQNITEEIHYIMRLTTQYYLEKAFEAMKVDTKNDPNTYEDLEVGNIGTPGRIAKTWVGGNLNDDSELASGRFMKPVRIASFPNTNTKALPITKRVSLISLCSHHLLAFSSVFDEKSYCIISYIPDKKVLGISKLQRLVDYVAKRMWLQEDLTKEIYKKVSEAAETPDVYVGLFNIKHSCEWIRGAKNPEGGFTSEYYDGKFNDDEIRNSVIKTSKN